MENTTATQEVNLVKGQKVDLTKTNPEMKKISFGLSWDLQDGATFDLDAIAIPLGSDGKQKGDLLFFGSTKDANGKPYVTGLSHSGDNLTGAGDGDDEIITLDTLTIPADVEAVVVAVNIYDAKPGQNFGQVNSASCRAFDAEKPTDSICKYDLNEDYSDKTAIYVGKAYRKDGQWKFEAMGEGATGDINQLTARYRS